jgi:hypothetical protein
LLVVTGIIIPAQAKAAIADAPARKAFKTQGYKNRNDEKL